MQRAPSASMPHIRKQHRWIRLGTVRAPDFEDPQYEFSNGHVSTNDPLLDGHIQSLQVHPNIALHAVEGCDLRTCTSSVPMQLGLHVVIVLEGAVDVAFGNAPLKLSAEHLGVPHHAQGAVVHVREPARFVRYWRTGKFERKLSLRVDSQFLQSLVHTRGYTHLEDVLAQHLQIRLWKPSARAVVLAEQIIRLTSEGAATLLLQSRVLELVHEAVQPVAQTANNAVLPTLQLREHERMAKLKTLLDTQQDKGAPVCELASQMGLSASALQRHFRQIYGTSIDEYRRAQRLEHAHALLAQTGCSVQEVAHASGYTSAANFATAFKRRFGISPKLVRSKM